MKSTADLIEANEVQGRRVLVRSDLNVPLDDERRITDDGRIRASAPTIQQLSQAGAKVIVMAHLGRPKGVPQDKFSLAPVAQRLGEVLGQPVTFATDTVDESAQAAVGAMKDGDIVLLENLRFNPGETSKDDAERGTFADALASLGEAYISDGFGVVHRKQASVYDVATRLPHAAGQLVATEMGVLRKLSENPNRPYAVVLGGAKVSDKLGVIANLLDTADRILIGGGMVFTFLKAKGYEVGKSLCEDEQVSTVKEYLKDAKAKGVSIVLPTDVVVADAFSADANHKVVAVDAIPADYMGLDIGPDSSAAFASTLAECKMVFWNGPVGAFEMEPYSHGTKAVAQSLATLTSQGGFTVIGGGDSAAAVRQLGFSDSDFSHISTGGGASLEYLEGATLPGIDILKD